MWWKADNLEISVAALEAHLGYQKNESRKHKFDNSQKPK